MKATKICTIERYEIELDEEEHEEQGCGDSPIFYFEVAKAGGEKPEYMVYDSGDVPLTDQNYEGSYTEALFPDVLKAIDAI